MILNLLIYLDQNVVLDIMMVICLSFIVSNVSTFIESELFLKLHIQQHFVKNI